MSWKRHKKSEWFEPNSKYTKAKTVQIAFNHKKEQPAKINAKKSQ